jgi:hypothetical protein
MFHMKPKLSKSLFDIGENFQYEKNILTDLFKPKSSLFLNNKPTVIKNTSVTQ